MDGRVSKALATCNKLKKFLKQSKCGTIWKLQVYNAVVISQLVYGLETLYLNDSLVKRLEAFHIRGLRHILGIEHSYWSKTSNLEVVKKANKILFGKNKNNGSIENLDHRFDNLRDKAFDGPQSIKKLKEYQCE